MNAFGNISSNNIQRNFTVPVLGCPVHSLVPSNLVFADRCEAGGLVYGQDRRSEEPEDLRNSEVIHNAEAKAISKQPAVEEPRPADVPKYRDLTALEIPPVLLVHEHQV